MGGRNSAVVITTVVILIVLLLLLFGAGMMGPWMMGYPFYGFGGFWWMWIVMVAFWILIIGGIVWLVLWLARQGEAARPGARGVSPLDIIRERYARGEITRDEYEQMRRDLEG